MPNQTNEGPSYVSDGVQIAIREAGSTDSFTDIGVMANGFTSTYQNANSEVEFGNAQNPDKVSKNLKLQIAPTELYTMKNNIFALLSGGLITEETTAGTPVVGGTQTVASGAWAYSQFIELTGKESDGSQPTINSVTGSVDGALVLDTDYFVMKGVGGWGIYIIDSATVTTEAQNIVIDSDYTPAAGSTLYSGTSSKQLSAVEVQIRHYTDDDLTVYDYELVLFRSFLDAGSFVQTHNGARSDTDFDTYTFTMTAETDDTREDGKQLFSEYRKTISA